MDDGSHDGPGGGVIWLAADSQLLPRFSPGLLSDWLAGSDMVPIPRRDD